MIFNTATTGLQDLRLPQWGRAFWQDPNDGELFLAYASGATEVDYITSDDSGQTWSEPKFLFPVDDFSVHNNFDVIMDRRGHIHCGFRHNESGCYQFVGKQSGGGWTISSGIGPVGWITAGDSGVAGFQGSLMVQESKAFSDKSIAFPAVKMVGKDSNDNIASAIFPHPFNGGGENEVVNQAFGGSIHVGPSGGFPIIYLGAQPGPSGPESRITFLDYDNQVIETWDRDIFGGGDYINNSFWDIDVDGENVGFAPNMAIGSGNGVAWSNAVTLCCTPTGQSLYVAEGTAFNVVFKEVEEIANGTDLFWKRRAGTVGGNPVVSGVVPTGLIYGVGPNTFSGSGVTVHDFPGGGTNCDFSFNDDGEMILYFQMKNESGKQAIGRMKSAYDTGDWAFAEIADEDSGLKYVATARDQHTGGFSNTLFWNGFKALRHPAEPNAASGNKLELLVTQGYVPTYPSGGSLTVWNVENSPGLSKWQIPEHSLDYTATSGTAYEVFAGVRSYTNVQLSSHYTEMPNMFDGDSTTRGRIRDGYTLGLELTGQQTIDRIEVLTKNLTWVPRMAISGSLDGDNWVRVVTIPSGRHSVNDYNRGNALLKYQTMGQTVTEDGNSQDIPGTPGNLVINNIDAFVAKYITFQFESPLENTSLSIHEIKLFGPGYAYPELVTWSNSTFDPPPYYTASPSEQRFVVTENFRRQQGTLPAGWSTYGDFEWTVVGSGDNAGGHPGTVESGLWSIIYTDRGQGDGFALRSEAIGDASGLGNPLGNVPVGGIQPGHTGVVEVIVDIQDYEIAEGFGVPSREIGFSLRADVHIDDAVDFITISPTEQILQPTGTLRISYGDYAWNNPPDEPEPYVPPYSTVLTGAGEHILRWVYRKGEYDPDTEIALGAAWIDNVYGLDKVITEYSRHGFVKGAGLTTESGAIHGYLNSYGSSAINGAVPLVSPLSSSINGYMFGVPQGDIVNSQINGFLKGNGLAINGFVLSSSGVTTRTFPTGSIHGYINVADSGINSSSINGYLDGGNYSSIYGFLNGSDDLANVVPTGDLRIRGYVRAEYPTSSIYGAVGSPVETFANSINGYVNSRFGLGDQVIHGYLGGPSGTAFAAVNGYAIGWNGAGSGLGPNQSIIYGFVSSNTESSGAINGFVLANKPTSAIHGYLGSEALVASGGGLVGSPSTSNVADGINLINGYVKGFDGYQKIHGYVAGNPVASSTINGYTIGGASPASIHGYSIGHALASGSIHGYLDAIGFTPTSIHGYGFGISGIIGSQIHGYTVGVDVPQSQVNGILIGIPQIIITEDSSAYCPSHNYPLSITPSITLPSGFIN